MKYIRNVFLILTLMVISINTSPILCANADGFSVQYDVNADGSFDVADVVIFQKSIPGHLKAHILERS